MEDNISAFYGTNRWMSSALLETGIVSCRFTSESCETIITFETDAHKNWFIIRWS
jgi:hypothetical protein